MNEDGFTLTEMLVAIAIIGLAIGGLSAGLQVLSRYQSATALSAADVEAVRAAQAALERVLNEGAPFPSRLPQRLVGTANAFNFDCGRPDRCSVRLETGGGELRLAVSEGERGEKRFRIRQTGDVRLVYRGARSAGSAWPPPDESRDVLRSVSVVSSSADADAPVVHARVFAEQPAACAFDVVIQDCR